MKDMASDWLTKCVNSDSDSRCETLNIVRVFFGSLSFVLSSFMIFLIVLYKKYMFFSQRLILYLSLAALADTIPYMMGTVPNAFGCKAQGYLMTYFDWTCVAWVCVITANGYRLIKEDISYESSESLFHLICWFIPALLAGIPFIWDAYGHSGPWCWIKGETTLQNVLRFLVWYGPVFVIVLALSALLIHLRIVVKRQNRSYESYNPEQENAKTVRWREVRILFMYPLVFILISIIPVITRIHMAFNKDTSFVLVLLTSITAPMLGAVNTLLYSCTPEMRQQIKPYSIWNEIRHRKRQTLAETYNFAEESPGNNRTVGPYEQ